MILFAPGERGGIPVLPPGVDDGSWSGGGGILTPTQPPSSGRIPGPEPEPTQLPGPNPYRRERSPSFCAGAEVTICGEAGTGPRLFGEFGPYTNDLCQAGANISCLVIGVFALLALLALGVNALLRS